MRRIGKQIGFAAVFTLLAAGVASAQLATWDQARVTEIAKTLATAAQGWETQTREAVAGSMLPAEEPDSLPGRARVLREMSDSLAAHLAKGDGYDKTKDQYRSIREVADDTEEAAQRSPLEEPVMDAWAKVADALRQIAPYYDPKANQGK
jgi:hypothetical protein